MGVDHVDFTTGDFSRPKEDGSRVDALGQVFARYVDLKKHPQAGNLSVTALRNFLHDYTSTHTGPGSDMRIHADALDSSKAGDAQAVGGAIDQYMSLKDFDPTIEGLSRAVILGIVFGTLRELVTSQHSRELLNSHAGHPLIMEQVLQACYRRGGPEVVKLYNELDFKIRGQNAVKIVISENSDFIEVVK